VSQLPLAFPLDEHASFDTFVTAAGSPVLAHLSAVASRGRGETLWLWGAPGSGKSHLLQAACRTAGEAGRRAMYIPLGGGDASDPELLHGLEGVELLALDDVERVAGEADWEQALFAVLESRRSHGGDLLLAATAPPAAAGIVLADLASRAAGAIVYRLDALEERERMRALIEHARHRGLELDEAAARYLLNRVERDMRALCGWLDRLDRAALAAKRRLTIPFIRSLVLDARDGE
jgi:DnaA-homolog protein